LVPRRRAPAGDGGRVEKEATPERAAVSTTHHTPNETVLDERWQRLAVRHVAGDGVLDLQSVPQMFDHVARRALRSSPILGY